MFPVFTVLVEKNLKRKQARKKCYGLLHYLMAYYLRIFTKIVSEMGLFASNIK